MMTGAGDGVPDVSLGGAIDSFPSLNLIVTYCTEPIEFVRPTYHCTVAFTGISGLSLG